MVVESLFSSLLASWEVTTLGEACIRSGGNIQTGPFGSQLHASDYVPFGIPSIMPQNIGDNRVFTEGIARITPEDAARLSRYLVQTGDIVYSRRGDVERRALIRAEEDGWLCGTGCLRVRFGNSEVDPLYASYYLGHPSVRGWIVRHAVGATMPNLNTSILSALPFVIPPLAEQKAIAQILSSLDDKIELNREMNQTLEAMARAIFKSWFVDFDPVRAKMEGRQPAGMDAATAELFPDEFEESALGMIPKGWKIIKLGNLIDIKHGYAFKGEFFRTEPPGDVLLTPGNFAIGGGFKDDKFKYYVGEVPEDFVFDEGDLLVTMTDLSKTGDTLGYPAIIPAPRGNRYLHNQRLGKISIKLDAFVSKLHLYYLLRTDIYRNEILASATGTTVKHTSPDRIKAFEFPFADNGISIKFEQVISSLHRRISLNDEQSRTLASIRDTLLPKLLSGEIRVKEAQKLVETVA